ncbi:MAG: tetratricopeptide repeat protein [Planctomycetaceae bacterium]|jgi:tetratricopeptide (TPR) repeat protein|nr:tetratricopeptide repeat protein [Planctomycetaceae bacterium]
MQKVHFLGKLSGANRKEAAEIVQNSGGSVAKRLNGEADLVVVGDENILKQDWNLWNDQLDAETREAFEKGTLSIISETQFWEKFGNQPAESFQTLYTPSMLAKLTGLPISILRKLHRERVIVSVRQVFRLHYFSREVILPLKIMQNMIAAGLSIPSAIHRLRKASQHNLANVHVEGKDLIFTSENGQVDQNGQQRFSFAEDSQLVEPPDLVDPLEILESIFVPDSERNDPVILCEAACELEASGNLQGAADLYRAALAAGGANPQINFQLAEILYRQGDLSAARERYFTAIELDEQFVEARANLGCLLAELGRDDLARAAFQGALKLHPDYAEVRFHFGMLLKRLGRLDEAEEQFHIFRELMPEESHRQHCMDAGSTSTIGMDGEK